MSCALCFLFSSKVFLCKYALTKRYSGKVNFILNGFISFYCLALPHPQCILHDLQIILFCFAAKGEVFNPKKKIWLKIFFGMPLRYFDILINMLITGVIFHWAVFFK